MVRAALTLLVLLASCGGGAGGGGSGTVTSEYRELEVPGARFYTRRITPSPPDHDDRTGILELDVRRLTGKEAMRALVVEKRVADPVLLARLSELFLDPVGGRLVFSPADGQGDPAAPRVTPPAVEGKTLTYWAWSGGMARMLRRSTVDLESFERVAMSAWDLRLAEDPLAVARELLKSPHPLTQRSGVDLAAKSCAREGAAALVVDTARAHARAETRAHAAWSLRACHPGPPVVALLVGLLEAGQPPEVRWKAAETLGVVGDLDAAAAIPALERAADDADIGLSHTVRRSLEALRGRRR